MYLPKINPDIIDSTIVSFVDKFRSASDQDLQKMIIEANIENPYFFNALYKFGTIIMEKSDNNEEVLDFVVIGGLFTYNILNRQIETDRLEQSENENNQTTHSSKR